MDTNTGMKYYTYSACVEEIRKQMSEIHPGVDEDSDSITTLCANNATMYLVSILGFLGLCFVLSFARDCTNAVTNSRGNLFRIAIRRREEGHMVLNAIEPGRARPRRLSSIEEPLRDELNKLSLDKLEEKAESVGVDLTGGEEDKDAIINKILEIMPMNTECHHSFHYACILESFRRNPTCPLCRYSIAGLKKLEKSKATQGSEDECCSICLERLYQPAPVTFDTIGPDIEEGTRLLTRASHASHASHASRASHE
jgi:hypothetical protein